MDTQVYSGIYQGLGNYLTQNASKCHNAKLVHFPATTPTYPYVIFDEIRNVQGRLSFGDNPDNISNLGYRVNIYAKTKGSKSKLDIARDVAQYVDNYCTNIGLRRVGYGQDPRVADSELYGVIMTYNANLYDNRKQIII